MKKILLCITLGCFTGFLPAQSVALDPDFGSNGKLITGVYGNNGNAYSIDIAGLSDGKIFVGGSINGTVGLEKYDDTGVLDTKFSQSFVESDGPEIGVCIQKDGKVLLVGENPVGLTTFVMRVDTLGILDPGFGIGGIAQTHVSHFFIRNIFEQSDGKIIVFGDECGS